MKAKISALMDGELLDPEIEATLRALREDAGAFDTWRRYHLIGDALRDSAALSSGFSTRFAARLAQEPTQFSPADVPRRIDHRRYRVPLSLAASMVAVALVGLVVYALQQDATQLAQTPVQAQAGLAENRTEALVELPRQADDYLRAHQNYSPRNSLQGAAPYVRAVSDSARSR